MKKFIKFILVLCFCFITCIQYETNRNNPFDPRSKNSLYYLQLLSGSGVSGLIGSGSSTGAGNSGRPDLQLLSFDPPTTMLHENTYNISATITKAGTVSASSFQVSIGLQSSSSFGSNSFRYETTYCIAGNPSYTNCGAVQVSSLSAGASTTLSIPLKVNSSQTTGINYIGIYLDSGLNLTEPSSTGESNNYGTSVGTHIKQVTVN